ncbi:hypothetical protein FC99_GL001923 [Levilactobacillus koreensis JCM 16448]|uniref:ABC-2 type transporter domain-containing protein n=1 Tax=Levilactobacillus koreensis TaxID=637971 RepID=A0AAC8UWM5_9LACO|nr:hypothetical protein [Levilactobacillus koreensis]AKP65243.1 hypothetical protein ABN16_09645 [Levilactobacillus koreensis]KRK86173.1 hypothetical protein FC99_GL001923 [Levilactobacillus koreensis JCM 16448]
MKVFTNELIIMFRYFLKVQTTQWVFLGYSILLPLIMIIPNLSIATHSSSAATLNTILPWIGFLTFSNAITANSDVVTLREQGYLKQYKTLVTSLSVFTFSKQLIWFAMQCAEILLISLVCAILYHINIVFVFGTLLIASAMTYFVLANIFQFLILLPINAKVLVVVNYICFAIAFFLAFSASKFFHLPLWSNPINFLVFCYRLLVLPRILPSLGYLTALILSFIFSRFILRLVNASPVERG